MFIFIFILLIYLLFQAEHDDALSAQMAESQKKEREVMKNVDNWKVGESVYATRWTAPTKGF